MKRFLSLLMPAAVALTLCAGSAAAATNYYLKIDTIDGASVVKGHEKAIELSSFSWGVSNSGSFGGGGGGGSGKTSFSDLSWAQGVDQSVVGLFTGVASGKHFAKATLDVVKAGPQPLNFFRMDFFNNTLSSLQFSGGGDYLVASASLQSSKITMTYWPQLKDGTRGTPIIGSWDLAANAPAVFEGDINVLTGLFLSGGNLDLGGLPIQAPVPEPQTWALMGLGLLALCLRVKASGKRTSGPALHPHSRPANHDLAPQLGQG